jgi:ubiquitin-protein ligase
MCRQINAMRDAEMNSLATDANEAMLEDELTAIEAIFGEDCCVNIDQRHTTVWVPGRHSEPNIKLTLTFPCSYPSSSPPVVELSCPHIPNTQHEQVCRELEDLFLPGEVRSKLWN